MVWRECGSERDAVGYGDGRALRASEIEVGVVALKQFGCSYWKRRRFVFDDQLCYYDLNSSVAGGKVTPWDLRKGGFLEAAAEDGAFSQRS